MATARQKRAARKNLEKSRAAQSAQTRDERERSESGGLTTAERDRLGEREFAFPRQRKEPITDASHVRNAIARFDQVEGVTDDERERAWQRIRSAARRFDVDVSAHDWRELFEGGTDEER